MGARDLLHREIEADGHGYDPVKLSAAVSLRVLQDLDVPVRFPHKSVEHALSSYHISVHPNTAIAIGRDVDGLVGCVREYLDLWETS